MLLTPDKLMIVAHPDDEVLWGGANLLAETGWMVICSTHKYDDRAVEFYRTMALAGVYKSEMFDVTDEYIEDFNKVYDFYKSEGNFISRLKQLSQKKWKLVLTHNEEGEYGHYAHMVVGYIVKKIFPHAKTFKVGKNILPASLLKEKAGLNKWYAATQTISKMIYNSQSKKLRISEYKHYAYEHLYVKPQKTEITPIIHQIWFGSQPAEWKQYLLNQVRDCAKKAGIRYCLWTSQDLTCQNFILTWGGIDQVLKKEKVLWAQVADLARYEIIYRYGGVYLDSNFIINDSFWPAVKGAGKNFVGANEDPCGLKCQGSGGKPYLSNGFFAASPRHKILEGLTSMKYLLSINYNSPFINRETGPYALGKFTAKYKNEVSLLPTEKIYPFMVNDSEYRDAEKNKCLRKTKTKNTIQVNQNTFLMKDCFKKYPQAYAVYQSGLGGTWSW